MDQIVGENQRLLVKQVKEWGEIILGFESRNRFHIMSDDGEVIGYAAEQSGGFGAMIARNLFGSMRKSIIHVYDKDGEEVASGKKPFRFYFHRMDLFEGSEKIGAIQRRFSILHRKFTLEDSDGNEILTVKSPFFRIWTFKLLLDGKIEVGRISKRWGGVLREMFTDADTFGVEFSNPKLPLEAKKLLVIAVFLIDFVCFENNQQRGGFAFGD